MERRPPTIPTTKLDPSGSEDIIRLRDRIRSWTARHLGKLSKNPDMPELASDRAMDCWGGMVAVAELLGEEWLAKAHRAAKLLSDGSNPHLDEDVGVMLLEDIRAIFDTAGVDRIASVEIIKELNDMEDRPWPEYQGRPLTPVKLAKILGRFRIYPGTIRLSSGTPKGYKRTQFEAVWSRYL